MAVRKNISREKKPLKFFRCLSPCHRKTRAPAAPRTPQTITAAGKFLNFPPAYMMIVTAKTPRSIPSPAVTRNME